METCRFVQPTRLCRRPFRRGPGRNATHNDNNYARRPTGVFIYSTNQLFIRFLSSPLHPGGKDLSNPPSEWTRWIPPACTIEEITTYHVVSFFIVMFPLYGTPKNVCGFAVRCMRTSEHVSIENARRTMFVLSVRTTIRWYVSPRVSHRPVATRFTD